MLLAPTLQGSVLMYRRHRLAQRTQFERMRRMGRAWTESRLVLVTLSNDLPYSRFGFVVGKRVGKAVLRNRIKRRMREAVAARLSRIPPGWDIVLVARTGIVGADFWSIAETLDALLVRAGITTQPRTRAETGE